MVMVVAAFGRVDMIIVVDQTNAKRGGHGGSKNMIGSRGADKVVQVPVGTVIYLVEGEIPSVVEKISSEVLEPWEIPGSLVNDSSESSDQSRTTALKSMNSSNASVSLIRNKFGVSTARELQFEASCHPEKALSSNKSSREAEASNSWKQEGNTIGEDLAVDHVSSEVSEEEFEVNAKIQKNVAELTEPGQRIVVAQGGNGGLGNISAANASKKTYKDTNTRVSDDDEDGKHVHFSAGLPGSEVVLVLELKSIADVGLVGMPNAGKSTLLGAMSKAKPTVGHYAFTTLRPNLGNLNYEDFSIKVADIPGIIRGAHENRGLGHAFLRHIERTKVLAYVVDLAAAVDGRKGLPPWKQLKELILELEFYQKGLSDRPSLVVANKIDEEGAEEVYEELKQRVHGVPIFPVCAVLEEGIPNLRDGLRSLMNGEETHKLKLDHIIAD